MSQSESDPKYVQSWKEDDGTVVEIPDDFDEFTEHLSAVFKAAEIASVQSQINNFGHKHINLYITTETEGNIRNLEITLAIENWREHTGGSSAYSKNDMVEYTKNENSAVPAEYIHNNGAFFHKLSNKFTDLISETQLSRKRFELSGQADNIVSYKMSWDLSRYDR